MTKALNKKESIAAVAERVKNAFAVTCDPEILIRDFDSFLRDYSASPKEKRAEMDATYIEKADQAMRAMGMNNFLPIAETLKWNRATVLDLARRLTEELDCKNASERGLVGLMVSAYGRMLDFQRKLNHAVLNCKNLSHEKNGFFMLLSREIDRAHRQYIAALGMLQSIKQPPIKISLKTDTAFIAQNQQLNKITKDEIVEP